MNGGRRGTWVLVAWIKSSESEKVELWLMCFRSRASSRQNLDTVVIFKWHATDFPYPGTPAGLLPAWPPLS